MKKIISFFILIIAVSKLHAQYLQGYPLSSSNHSMGLCAISFDDVRGVFANPSSIVSPKQIQSCLFLDQRFNISELKSISATILIPTLSGNFAFSFNRFGFELYNENMFQLTYGRKILNNLNIGGAIQYHSLNIQEYGNKSIIGFQLGVNSSISKTLSFYCAIQNPHRPEINIVDKLPGYFSVGFQYKPTDLVSFHGELNKELDFKEDFRFGIEYHPLQSIFLRLGGHTYPAQVGFGFGFLLFKSLIIEASSQYHSILGFNNGIGLSYGIISTK